MSSQSTSTNTSNQLTTKTDISKIFVGGNRYEDAEYNNSGYDTESLVAGTVMGRVHATGKIKPLRSDNGDGSQIPVGILAEDKDVEAGDTVELTFCVAGDVVSGKLVFEKSGDTLDTVVSSRRLRDRIGADTVGIKLVGADELTDYDNE